MATDLVLPGNAGLDLRVTRVYNSNVYPNYSTGSTALDEDSWAGVGWKLHFGRLINPDSTVGGEPQVEMGDGSRHALYHGPGSTWISTDFWLYDRSAYTVKLPNGLIYVFGRPVYLNATLGTVRYVTEIRDPFNNRLTFSYFDANGPPDGVQQVQQHLSGSQIRTVSFTYNTTLKSLATMSYNGRTWSYAQHGTTPTGYSILDSVQPPAGPAWSYQYTGTLAGEMTRLTTPSGGYVTYTYQDATRRASTLTQLSRVVSSRTTGGPSITPGTWNYSYGTGSNQDTTEVSCPCGTTKYRFAGTGLSGTFAAWTAGLLVQQTVVENNGTVLEDRAMTYIPSETISADAVSGTGGVWSDSSVKKALLQLTTVTRGVQSWTIQNAYHTGLGNYNDYGRPYWTQETESPYRWRITTVGFQYGFTPYIVDRVGSVSIQIKTAYAQGEGPETVGSWTYAPATGFLTGQTVNSFTTGFTATADGKGNVAAVVDGLGNSTTYSYDWGVVKEVLTPGPPVTRTTYVVNSDGLVTSVNNNVDTAVTYQYDASGFRIWKIKRAGAQTLKDVIYEYDNVNGRFVREARDLAQTESQLDGFGRVIGSSNQVGLKTRVERDACGRTTFSSAPYTAGAGTRGTTTTYDAVGRPLQATNPAGDVMRWVYSGLDVQRIDGENRGALFHYSGFGGPGTEQLVSVTDAIGIVTTYEYNLFGDLATVVGPNAGVIRTWSRAPRVRTTVQPESGTTTTDLDNAGNVIKRTTAGGAITTYTYDADNRLKTVDAAGTADDLTLTYDAAGRLTSQVGGGTTTTFGYDEHGRVAWRTDVTNGQTFNSSYGYDADDRLVTLGYPSTRSVTYTYDVENRLLTVKNNGSTFANNFQYDDNGQLKSYLTGSVTHAFTPDVADRPARIQATGSGGALDLNYTYDHAGNVKVITDPRPGMNQTFDYDPLHRMFAADGPWGQLRWSFDNGGNRLSEIRGATTTYTYNASTQRLTSTSGAVSESFSYDTLGRLTADARGTYGYNARDLLSTFSRSGISATYAYDGSGLRIGQTVNGHTTYTIRDAAGTPLSEYRAPCAAAVWSRDLVYAGGRLIGAVRSTAAQPTVKLTASAVSVSEAATSVTVTAKLNTSANLACPVTVAYETVAVTATAGWDFAGTSGTLTFAAGSANNATATITVPLLPDTTFEPNETFSVVLSSVTGGTVAAPGAAVVTITDNDPTPLMAIVQPTAGTVKTPFTVSGWAIDSTVATGTGVDIVHVYATPSGGSATFLGAATYGVASPDIGTLYGSRFSNAGYTFSATLTPGAYVVTVYARNSATGVFNQSRTVSVTVAPSSISGAIEAPTSGQTWPQPFLLSGWAVDTGSGAGTGVNRVQIWAFLNPGSGTPETLVGDATIGISRPDVANVYGPQFQNAGFQLQVRGLAPGTYQLKAKVRSTVTSAETWLANSITLTVQANPHMWVDTPTANSAVTQTFTVAGWAVDLAAASGTGVNTLHVWAYPTTGSPIFLGAAGYGGARGDIGALYGAQFTNSGFSLTASLAPGTYQLVVYAWSLVENTFNQAHSLTITVASSTPLVSLEAPAAGATVGQPFTVGGWAIDQGAPSGTGIDAVHVYAVANNGAGASTFLGAAPNTGARPDVGAAYGSPFTNSGFTMSAAGLAAGGYRLDVYVHSTVSGQWTVVSRLITVQ